MSFKVASVTTPSSPSEPTNKPVEVEAGLVLVGASAQADDVAAGQDDFQTEDKIAGDAVFEAARAAGVGGDVAADGAIGAAGGIGRIVEPLFSTASCRVCRMTPGWTTATKSPVWISRMRFMRARERTMPPRAGTQPPT